MIARLRGILLDARLTDAVIETGGGVGYAVTVPLSTYDRLPRVGHEAALLIHFTMREDGITLYGFATEEERELFRLLLAVSGVGPRLALNALSCMPVSSFCQAVVNGDVKALTRINGVGKRGAERMVVELRDRIEALHPEAGYPQEQAAPVTQEANDAMAALQTLGFKPDAARKAVDNLLKDPKLATAPAEALIRRALQGLKT